MSQCAVFEGVVVPMHLACHIREHFVRRRIPRWFPLRVPLRSAWLVDCTLVERTDEERGRPRRKVYEHTGQWWTVITTLVPTTHRTYCIEEWVRPGVGPPGPRTVSVLGPDTPVDELVCMRSGHKMFRELDRTSACRSSSW